MNCSLGKRMFLLLAAVMLALPPVGTAGQTPAGAANDWQAPRTPYGTPDLSGVWNFSTLTPLERPADLAGKEFLTEAEAADYAKRTLDQRNADRRDGAGTFRASGEDTDVARAYNEFWYDRGNTVVGTRRTSLIIDPRDGKLPPMTAEGRRRANALQAYAKQDVRGPFDNARTRPLRERCIWWDSSGPPLSPMGAYNANIQLLQTKDHVAIFMEMIHDVRIVPLDGRPHLPATVSQLHGDSRGRWDGDTLVVETTHFQDKADFIDSRSFTPETDYRGTGPGARLTERFKRVGPDTLLYEYTVNDPATWTRPWTAQLYLTRSPEPMYEYACHEGNYGIVGILSGARAAEAKGR